MEAQNKSEQQKVVQSDKPGVLLFLCVCRDGVGSLSYRMLDCPDKVVIAQVDDKGFLLSGSLTGTSSLLITSQETFGVSQTLILTVKVSWGL